MFREEALGGEGFWAGHATTDAGMVSGWHHHGENDSVIYVLRGSCAWSPDRMAGT